MDRDGGVDDVVTFDQLLLLVLVVTVYERAAGDGGHQGEKSQLHFHLAYFC